MKPATPEAHALMQDGAIALAEVECNGMAVDVPYIERAIKRSERRAQRLQDGLMESDVAKVWKRTYGGRMNLQSPVQLGNVLFGKMKYPSPGTTSNSKRHKTDEASLRKVDHPFVKSFLEIKKIRKSVSTNLRGIMREVVDGKVHCFFNLHTTTTYRSSSDSFNFQNIPIRDPEQAALIRRAFIARPGRQLVEVDFSGAEVRVSACYNKDPVLISYILDKTKDMHRDMAMQIFKLPQKEVTKAIRHKAKNQFVFPEFYGAWYLDCAKGLWEGADNLNLESGGGLIAHLKSQGIKRLGACDPDEDPVRGTFEYHVQQIEKDFWGKRFKVYSQWKRDWYAEYLEKSYFRTLTGFVCQGFMDRKQVINFPVQGSAFHCLLWVFIQLVRREMRRRKMKSLIVGQIHDSIVADVVPSELQDYLALCHRVITKDLLKHFPWIIVPIEAEAEAAPVGGSWLDKKAVEFAS